MMANVFDVAKYILQRTGKISTWKLQKLCYYSQAWTLAWTGKPLFEEEFEAWRNGPVCESCLQGIKVSMLSMKALYLMLILMPCLMMKKIR